MADEPRKRGRPEGSQNRLAREARAKALETGLLPHEILLDIARGEPQEETYLDAKGERATRIVSVDLDTRLEAAKAAAPYYAPKISTVEVISGVSDDDLDAIIARAAAEAGVSLGAGGEGEEDVRTSRGATQGAHRATGSRRVPLD